MPKHSLHTACVFLLLAASLGAGTESRQAADALSQKFATITQRGAEPKKAHESVTLTEEELNSWFQFRSGKYLPAGVSRPSVTLLGSGTMKGTATVDLEAVGRRRSSGGLFDPFSYLVGRVPVTVTGVLRTKGGVGQFDVQSSEVAGIPVPKTLLQELVAHYSGAADQKDGLRLDDSFALPANIQRIDVGRGQMVVVQ
jgi:hypothetical protein